MTDTASSLIVRQEGGETGRLTVRQAVQVGDVLAELPEVCRLHPDSVTVPPALLPPPCGEATLRVAL